MYSNNNSKTVYPYSYESLMPEVELSAKLIWNGIKELNQVVGFNLSNLITNREDYVDVTKYNNQEKYFMVLYYLSVGIERVQKVILKLALYPKENYNNKESKLLMGHNIESLNQKLQEDYQYSFEKKIIHFIQLLSNFDKLRYVNLHSEKVSAEYFNKFQKFLNENVSHLEDRQNVLETIGIIVGTIVSRYNTILKNVSDQKGVFLTEYNSQKDAYYIFNSGIFYQNSSLQQRYEQIKISKCELIYYLINENSSDSTHTLPFPPIPFDSSFFPFEVKQYISFLYNDILIYDSSTCVETYYCDVLGASFDKGGILDPKLDERRKFITNFVMLQSNITIGPF